MPEDAPANTMLRKGLRIRSCNYISGYYEVNTTAAVIPEFLQWRQWNARETDSLLPFRRPGTAGRTTGTGCIFLCAGYSAKQKNGTIAKMY